jgi:hypothetical protein
MKKINDGGPAFPLQGKIVKQYQPTGLVTGESLQGYQPGMSLRDYFAAKAMQAMAVEYDMRPDIYDVVICEKAYKIADAMLAAREAGK